MRDIETVPALPMGMAKVLYKLSKSARYLYDTIVQRVDVDTSWTDIIDSAWLRRETGYSAPKLSRAKRELLDANLIRQRQQMLNGKPQRGAFRFYICHPFDMSNVPREVESESPSSRNNDATAAAAAADGE